MEKLDISYFKKKKGFQPLFLEFRKKYSSYGSITGTIKIENATEETKEALSGLLAIDFKRDMEIKVSIKKFERALEKTIYKNYTLLQITEAYFGKKLRSRKEIQIDKEEAKYCYFRTFYTHLETDFAHLWLDAIMNKNALTKIVSNYYEKDINVLSTIMKNVILGLNRLPLKEYERLPIFSANTTKNPHCFDIGTDSGRVLLSALQLILYDNEGKDYIPSPKSEEITEILSRFNIMRDDINNDVTVFGLQGYYQDGSTSNLLLYASEENMVINLPLREVVRLAKIKAINNTVYVIENSGLYSTLIDKVIDEDIDVSIICSSGQINLATWKLIEKLVKNNQSIFYSGDFDPEGILMAYKMKKRYKNNVFYWHMDIDSYMICKSDEQIKESRLNQLLDINDNQITPLINTIKQVKKSGYQERLLGKIISDFINNY